MILLCYFIGMLLYMLKIAYKVSLTAKQMLFLLENNKPQESSMVRLLRFRHDLGKKVSLAIRGGSKANWLNLLHRCNHGEKWFRRMNDGMSDPILEGLKQKIIKNLV